MIPPASAPEVLELGRGSRRPGRRGTWVVVALLLMGLGAAAVIRALDARPPAPAAKAPAGPTAPAPPPSSPGVTAQTTDLGHSVLGVTAPYELFGRGPGAVIRIQLAAGRVSTSWVPALDSTGPVSFVVTSRAAIVRPLDVVPGYVVPDEGLAQRSTGRLGQHGPAWPGPTPGSVWVVDGEGSESVLTRTDAAGRLRGPRIPVPDGLTWSIRADGRGGLVRIEEDGFVVVGDGRWRRLSRDPVLAVGGGRVLTENCSAGRCRLRLHDLSGRPIWDPGSTDEIDTSDGYLSPSGRYAALAGRSGPGGASGPAPALRVLDLREYRETVRVEGGALAGVVDAVWAPDGRWLFVVTRRGDVRALDPATGRVAKLGVWLPRVSQLAIRAR